MNKRLSISLLLGAILGILCIIGVGARLGFAGNEVFLFGVWLNRVIIGLVIGLAGSIVFVKNKFNPAVRGLFFGFLISFSLLVVSDFRDIIGFIPGIFYGLIIDVVATKYDKK